jgi:hypothetical protein
MENAVFCHETFQQRFNGSLNEEKWDVEVIAYSTIN